MKKTILLMIVLWFFAYSSNGQQIDSLKHDLLVDYVNCEYVKTYCNNYIKGKDNSKSDIYKYNNIILPIISKNCIQNPVKKEILSQLLESNGWSYTNKKLVEVINKNKQSEICIESIVSTDCLSQNLINILDSTKTKLKKEIDSTLESESKKLVNNSNGNSPQQTVEKTSSDQNSSDGDSKSKSISVDLLIILLLVEFFVILIIGRLYKNSRNKKNKIKRSQTEKTENAQIQNEAVLEKEIKKLKEEKSKSEKIITELKNENNSLKQQLQSFQQKNPNPIDTTSAPTSPMVKYLGTAREGVFHTTFDSPNDCYFKVFDFVGNNAKFEFCGDSEFGIANRDALFDNVGIINGSSFNAHRIKNVTPGVLESMANGQWKVKEKAQIKFEE